eukprot:CAMPEP_0113526514 /NCGR_PEP_ID=MMETSP0015_2-20120614/783_1 /TAXON_ID=2838 /ORGANISM="Odontella" /LENGTH=126 /DNA_ID=CAMNT_0000424847 /DNA_START=260 /DNA_END=640 /DNA_ORIENTATION=+ /assembly_acc=CAM_ASM_000160
MISIAETHDEQRRRAEQPLFPPSPGSDVQCSGGAVNNPFRARTPREIHSLHSGQTPKHFEKVRCNTITQFVDGRSRPEASFRLAGKPMNRLDSWRVFCMRPGGVPRRDNRASRAKEDEDLRWLLRF